MDHLRFYQNLAVESVFKEWETHDATGLHMATGTGKTVCIAEIVRRSQPKRALILAHRIVLVEQAKKKVVKFAGLATEIEMGMQRARRDLFRDCAVVVSSVQSQTPGRRSKPTDFDLLIIDEFHHCKGHNKSYMDVINHYRQNPNLKILGVTATLEADCLKIIPNIAFTYDILDAINDGYLVNIEQKVAYIHGLDYSHIRTTAGDLNGADLAAVMEAEEPCQKIIQATLETMFSVEPHSLSALPIEQWSAFLFLNGHPKKNLVFASSVAHARMMSDIFNRIKPGLSKWICSDKKLLPEEDRIKVEEEFLTGDLLICVNVGIYNEGYDNPRIEMVTMARPTKSKTLYIQQLGRGTRTIDGTIDGILSVDQRLSAIASSPKKVLTVLDLAGNSGRHTLISTVDVLGAKVSEEARQRVRKKSTQSNKPQNILGLLAEAEAEIKAARLKREQIEAERKKMVVAKTDYSLHVKSPFEQYNVRKKEPTWWDKKHGRQFSEAQRKSLRNNLGVDPDTITYACGCQLLAARSKGPCSSGQARVLRDFGYSTECSMQEARAIIDKIAANNWKRPVETMPENV